jgi:hypothetical protein
VEKATKRRKSEKMSARMSFKSINKNNILVSKCNMCDQILADDALRSHVNECPAKSVSVDKQNVVGKKDEENVFACKLCSFVSLNRQQRKLHLHEAHPWSVKHRCKVCPAKYPLGIQLLHHVESAHFNMKRWKCRFCDYSCNHGGNFARHMSTMHDRSSGDISSPTDKLIKNEMMEKKGKGVLHSSITSGVKENKDKGIDPVRQRNIGMLNNELSLTLRNWKDEGMSMVNIFARRGKKEEPWLNDHSSTVKFKCDDCEHSSVNTIAMKRHNRDVHQKPAKKNGKRDGKYPDGIVNDKNCLHCKFVASNAYKLLKHVKDVHFKVKGKKCSKCKYATPNSDNLSRHMKSVHLKIKDKKCPLCDYATYHTDNMARHMRVHQKRKDNITLPNQTNQNKFDHPGNTNEQGMDADYPTGIAESLSTTHVNVHHKMKDIVSVKKLNVESHIERLRASLGESNNSINAVLKDKQCPHCDYATSIDSSLSMHLRIHQNVKDDKDLQDNVSVPKNADQSHVQSDCVSKLADGSNVEVKADFKDIKHKKCQHCAFITDQVDTMNLHVKESHKKLKELKCKHCDFITYQADMMKHHVQAVHMKIKGKKCKLCDFATHKDSNMNDHVKLAHLKIRDKKCQQCNFATYRQSTLNGHVKSVHSKIKDKICPHCDFTTNRVGTLNDHVKAIHTKIKDNKCPHCSFATGRVSHLTEHVKSVHLNIRDKKCGQCDYSAKRASGLRDHVKGVHGKI